MLKKIKIGCIALISCSGICFSTNWHTESLLTHAERLELVGSHGEAVDLYLKALGTLNEKEDRPLQEKIQWRAACASFLSGDDGKTLSILKEMKDSQRPEKWFLRGFLLRKGGKIPEAETALLTFLQKADNNNPLTDRCRWELAQLYFHRQEFDQALPYLDVLTSSENLWMRSLAHLDLAWDLLRRNKAEKALAILNAMDSYNLPSKELIYTQALLRGEAFLILENEEEALQIFSYHLDQLPADHPFLDEITYLSGWGYLKLASKILYDPNLQEGYFNLAIDRFQKLVDAHPKEETILSLAQAYLAKGKQQNDLSSLHAAERLLQRADLLSSREARAHALLIRAEVSTDHLEKDRLFRLLTSESHRGNSWYIQGWLLRGLNDLAEGERYLNHGEIVLAHDAFQRSDHTFQQAFIEAKAEVPATAIQALIWRVEALLTLNNPASSKKGYQLIRQFLKTNSDLITTTEQSDELYYLYGKAAWALGNTDGYEKAKKCWKQIYETHPQSSWAPTALFSLATMEYEQKNLKKAKQEAKELFLLLQEKYPTSSYAGDSLYFASLCDEALGTPPPQIAEIRRRVWQNYPHSRYAAEAYYHEYPYSAYAAGSSEAIEHLHRFLDEYNDSPYVIHAYYLEGMRLKDHAKTLDLPNSLEAFSLAEKKYFQLKEEDFFSFDDLPYYTSLRNHIALERATTTLQAAQLTAGVEKRTLLEEAQKILLDLQKEMEAGNDKTSRDNVVAEEMQPLVEESSYTLGRVHILLGNDAAAERIFDNILKNYKEKKITRGYFLSRIWFEKGDIALRQGEYALALEHLNQAEDCGRGKILNGDQLVEIWILKSTCYRHLNNLEQAMWYLSRAANESVITPRRLEAMYLRAEIYEEQGRHELALRQLQTLSSTGGSWGEKAKTKLKEKETYVH